MPLCATYSTHGDPGTIYQMSDAPSLVRRARTALQYELEPCEAVAMQGAGAAH